MGEVMKWRTLPGTVAPGHPAYCAHTKCSVVMFRCDTGVMQARTQCLVCGEVSGQSVRQSLVGSIPLNASLAQRRLEVIEDAWRAWSDNRCAERDAAQATADAAWWAAYNAYLRSPEWQRLRGLALDRDHARCQARMKNCTLTATQCHHLTYSTYIGCGMTALHEVVSVCASCHDTITAAQRAARKRTP